MNIEEIKDVVQEPPPPVMDTILNWIGFEQELPVFVSWRKDLNPSPTYLR
jgi:hypothetical protein